MRLDRTEKLLLALKKRKLIGARQAARLLLNHSKEARSGSAAAGGVARQSVPAPVLERVGG